MLAACRNSLLRPDALSRRLRARSPYFRSPATGWPSDAQCTRILVGAAGMRNDLCEGDPGTGRDCGEIGHRVTSVVGDPHHPLASGPVVALEGQIHPPAPGPPPGPSEEREVPLVEGSPAQPLVQGPERAPALGDDEASRGVPVEPVHELEIARIGAGRPQQLDCPVRDAAPAMRGEAGGLVQNEQPLVLVDNRAFDLPDPSGRRAAVRPPLPEGNDGRDPDRFPGPQATARPRPRSVDPHLAAPKQPVQPVAGNFRQLGMQEVVDPATVVLVVDRHVPRRAALGSDRPGGRRSR